MPAVLGFYKFIHLDNPGALADSLRQWGSELNLLGSVLVAPEGINGSLAGEVEQLQQWQARLQALAHLADMRFLLTTAGNCTPFYKFKVKLRREIIPLADGTICPKKQELQYLDALAWNELLADPEALIIDVRNAFEYRLGHFPGALDPQLKNFADFATCLQNNAEWAGYRRVGMYCTGGIRCEKAATLWQDSVDAEVYQLNGGIINYLQSAPPQRNAWRGDCFVFDYRVSLNRELRPGDFTLCFGCGEPLSTQERDDPRYNYGITCPYCIRHRSADSIKASKERLHQIELARLRGEQGSKHSLIGHCLDHSPPLLNDR